MERVEAAFELAQMRVNVGADVGLAVADGVAAWGLVVGEGRSVEGLDLGSIRVVARKNGDTVFDVTSRDAVDDQFASIALLANELGARGAGHRSGSVRAHRLFRRPRAAVPRRPLGGRALLGGLGRGHDPLTPRVVRGTSDAVPSAFVPAERPPAASVTGPSRGALASLLSELRDRDHTRAGLLGSVLVLALPSMITGIFGHGLFQIVELRFLGELGPDAVAAAGASNQILRQVLFLPTFGMSIAVQMWIALRIGAGLVEDAERAAGQAFVIGAALALVAAIAGLFAGPLVGLVSQDAAVVALGTAYIRITFFTLSAVIATQLFTSVLMGAGESTTPLLITIASTPLSIGAQWVLTFGGFGIPPLGIAGIAWGAAVGGLFGTAASLWVLFTGRCRVHVRGVHLLPNRRVLAEILSFGWQPTAHFFARSLIIMAFMWLAGRLGGPVQAAFTIGLRLEILVAMVAFPIASACATLVGQNLGAGDTRRAWRAIAVSMASVTGVTAPRRPGPLLLPPTDRGLVQQRPRRRRDGGRVSLLHLLPPRVLRSLFRGAAHAPGRGRHEHADADLGHVGALRRNPARCLALDLHRPRGHRDVDREPGLRRPQLVADGGMAAHGSLGAAGAPAGGSGATGARRSRDLLGVFGLAAACHTAAVEFAAKVDLWFLLLFYGLGGLMVLGAPALRHRPRGIAGSLVLIAVGWLFIGVAWRASSVRYVITEDGYLEATGWPFDGRITALGAIHRVEPSRDPRASHAASLDRLRIDYGEGGLIFIAVRDETGFLDALARGDSNLERTARGIRRLDR